MSSVSLRVTRLMGIQQSLSGKSFQVTGPIMDSMCKDPRNSFGMGVVKIASLDEKRELLILISEVLNEQICTNDFGCEEKKVFNSCSALKSFMKL